MVKACISGELQIGSLTISGHSDQRGVLERGVLS
jgi:hypothetical protein